MSPEDLEWDSAKVESNLAKHRVPFEAAVQVFSMEGAWTSPMIDALTANRGTMSSASLMVSASPWPIPCAVKFAGSFQPVAPAEKKDALMKTHKTTKSQAGRRPYKFSAEERPRLEMMSDGDADRIAREDPDNPPLNDEVLETAVIGRRIRRTRERLGLSQAAFAARYCIPVATLRDWEQGRHRPDATTRAYLSVIEREHEAVERALEH